MRHPQYLYHSGSVQKQWCGTEPIEVLREIIQKRENLILFYMGS